MPRSVILEHVQAGRDGSLLIRIAKQVTLGKQVHSSEPHLHRVEPGEAIAEALSALDRYLDLNGWDGLGKDDAEFAKAIHATATKATK